MRHGVVRDTIIFLLLYLLVDTVKCKIQPCRNTPNEQTQYSSIDSNVKFTACVTAFNRPFNEAFVDGAIWCRESVLCQGKYQWSLQKVGTSKAYTLVVWILNVDDTDYDTHLFQLFDNSNSTSTLFQLHLEKKTQGIVTAAVTTTTTQKVPIETEDPKITTIVQGKGKTDAVTVVAASSTPGAKTVPSFATFSQSPSLSLAPIVTLPSSLSSTPSTTSSSSSLPTSSSSTSFMRSTKLPTSAKTMSTTINKSSTTPVKTSSVPPATTTATATTSTSSTTTTTITPKETTTGESKGCFSLPMRDVCPPNWYQPRNTTACVMVGSRPEPLADALKFCQVYGASLLVDPKSIDNHLLACITDDKRSSSIWINQGSASSADDSPRCNSFDMISNKRQERSCDDKLNYLCEIDAASYAKPQITAFKIYMCPVGVSVSSINETCIGHDISDSQENHLWLRDGYDSLRVSCSASGSPSPTTLVQSTLLNHKGRFGTVDTMTYFRYDKPSALIGRLGTVACVANTDFGDEISSASVAIGATYTPQVLSFQQAQLQLFRGDNMTLRCESYGFPQPIMKISRHGSTIPLAVSKPVDGNLEYTMTGTNCASAGIYRCEAKDPISGKSDWKNIEVQIFKCPPNCPKNLKYLYKEEDNTISLSWQPGFNGGGKQNFTVFYKTNNVTWNKHQGTALKNETSYVMNISELPPSTVYSFRVAAQNIYADGEFSAATCPATVTFTKESSGPNSSIVPSKEPTVMLPADDGSSIITIVVCVVLVVVATVVSLLLAARMANRRRQRKNSRSLVMIPDMLSHATLSEAETTEEIMNTTLDGDMTMTECQV